MDLLELIQTRTFLGNEFLMWLWFKSDCFDGLFAIADHGDIEVIFDNQLTLEAYLAETERSDFKGGTPAFAPEAKTALRQGKRVSKAKIRIVKEGREWLFTYKAEGMDITSAKIPAVLSKDDDERFFERMYLLEELEEILETLYAEFINLRLSDAWGDTLLPAMQEWIQSDELTQPHHYPVIER